ncbi:hypothetical protein FRB90_012628 [Tulasnella sp. 427]|nr:hypothetical protein FRB90_012628 [Tulasnella sp. 427]
MLRTLRDRSLTLKQAFKQEVGILSKLSHPNIVELLGIVENETINVALVGHVMEQNGVIREFLATGEWAIPARIPSIQDVAEGLAYLHSTQLPICHGNLKSLVKLLAYPVGFPRRANALNGLANLYLALVNFPKSEELFSKALGVSDGLSYDPGRGTAYLGLGISNRAHGNCPAAERFFVRGLDVYTRISNVVGEAQSLNELGHSYIAQGRYNEAEMCNIDTLVHFRHTGQAIATTSVLLSLGHVSMARNNLSGAEKKLREARDMFILIGHANRKNSTERYLAQIHNIRQPPGGQQPQLFLIISCLGAAFIAWSAMERVS